MCEHLRLFVRSFVLFIRSLVHSMASLLVCSFVDSFVCSFIIIFVLLNSDHPEQAAMVRCLKIRVLFSYFSAEKISKRMCKIGLLP